MQRDRPLLAQCDAEIPLGIFIFGAFICFTVAAFGHLLQTRAGLFSNKHVCSHSGVAQWCTCWDGLHCQDRESRARTCPAKTCKFLGERYHRESESWMGAVEWACLERQEGICKTNTCMHKVWPGMFNWASYGHAVTGPLNWMNEWLKEPLHDYIIDCRGPSY